MQALIGTASAWKARIERAHELVRLQGWAAEVLTFYAELAARQAAIAERAAAERPAVAGLPAWVAANSLPTVVEIAVAKGPASLAQGALATFNEANLEDLIRRWLTGQELPAIAAFVARAATGPVLEVMPDLAAATGVATSDDRHCPTCGGAPQLSYFAMSGEALVTAPRYLQCSRCAHSWVFPRLVCAGCGESDAPRLGVLAANSELPALRVDTCETCRRYLITIDLPKDPGAVPIVDELAALPLDLHAKECGLRKVTPNLMGF